MPKPRVLLVDDHPLVLDSVRQLLEPNITVLGTIEQSKDVLPAAKRLKPDIVMLDASMPDTDGFEIARQLKAAMPSVQIIFLTMLGEAISISEGFRAGAMGYVLKQSAAEELHEAVENVLANKRYLSKKIDADVREAIEHEWFRPEGYSSALTERQREILRLLADGQSAKSIAKKLNISTKTVEFHKANITRKLGVHTTSELIRFALAHGMTTL